MFPHAYKKKGVAPFLKFQRHFPISPSVESAKFNLWDNSGQLSETLVEKASEPCKTN